MSKSVTVGVDPEMILHEPLLELAKELGWPGKAQKKMIAQSLKDNGYVLKLTASKADVAGDSNSKKDVVAPTQAAPAKSQAESDSATATQILISDNAADAADGCSDYDSAVDDQESAAGGKSGKVKVTVKVEV